MAERLPVAAVVIRMQPPVATLEVAHLELLDQHETRIIMHVQNSLDTTDGVVGHRHGTSRRTGLIGAVVATAAAVGSVMAPTAVLAEPQGYLQDELGVGYIYGTFDPSDNLALLVGGTAEDLCNEPGDPFDAEPGSAPLRVFLRKSGAVDLKVNDKDQPIHLYHVGGQDAADWLAGVCEDVDSVPAPFASGTADLKVRISIITDDLVDVFNSVNGKAAASDGTEYKVRASADLVVEDGVPVGDPSEFVRLQVTEIGR
jgi:hypothetical protein